LLKQLRHAVGLRDLSTAGDVPSEESGAARAAPPLFKQYREQDGRFYFKLQASDGTLLIQSEGFDSPRDAGQLIGVLKQTEHGDGLQSELFKLEAEVDVVLAALQALRE
jgi:tryptophanyl-tRNA synthetase